MSRKVAYWIALLLLATGLGASEYLLLRAILLAREMPQAGDWCSALFGHGCDAALKDPASRIAGIPLAGWGVAYFGSVILVLVLGWALDGFRRASAIAALALGIAAALAGVFLAVEILNGTLPLCPLCLVLHGLDWALLPFLWVLAQDRSAARAAPDSSSSAHPRARLHIAGGAVLSVAIAAALLAWISRTWREATALDPRRIVASHVATPRMEIPVSADDPMLGVADATVRLILFSDFQCPACREFARVLPEIVRRFPGRVSIRFKHYPLSSSCHPRLKADFHPGSCEAAYAAEAARRQGSFWEFHDRLFASGGPVGEALTRAMAEAGLDAARFEADLRDPAVRARVAADIALGIDLGVDGTPVLFVNGRRVRDLRPDVLYLLIAAEIEEAGK